MFRAALFPIAKTWKQPKRPSADEWIKKIWYSYATGYYSAIEKNEIMSFATIWMDLEITLLNDIRQRQVAYDIAYMWNLLTMIQDFPGGLLM